MANITTNTSTPLHGTIESLVGDQDLSAALEWAAEHAGADIVAHLAEGVDVIAAHQTVNLHTIDDEKYLGAPRRISGTVTAHTTAALGAYVTRFGDATRLVWVSPDQVVAVLNEHTNLQPGWRDHRIVMPVKRHPLFTELAAVFGKPLDQEVFADLVETLERAWTSPAAGTMLEVAQTIHINGEKKLSSSFTLRDGSIAMSYVSQDTAVAGRNADLTVPSRVELTLPVFEGTDSVATIRCRLRTRRSGGQVMFVLLPDETADQIVQRALDGLSAEIAAAVGDVPVIHGKP